MALPFSWASANCDLPSIYCNSGTLNSSVSNIYTKTKPSIKIMILEP